MTVRVHLGRCLLVLLAMGIAAQAIALAAHQPYSQIVGSASDAEDDHGHDPDSCGLCYVLSQGRIQAPAAGVCAVPLFAFENAFLSTPVSLPSRLGSASSNPRAPPSNSIS